MAEVHQHPDGQVFVRGDDGKLYVDSPDNFALDFGTSLPALPIGADDHVYTQGRRHAYMGGGDIIDGGPMPWPEGDRIIAKLESGLQAQSARIYQVVKEIDNKAKLTILSQDLIKQFTDDDNTKIKAAVDGNIKFWGLWSAMQAQSEPMIVTNARFLAGWSALTQVLGATRMAAIAEALGVTIA